MSQLARIAGGLDVVVRVEQDGGRAGRGRAAGDHGGLAVGDGQDVDLGQAGGLQERRDLVGAVAQVGGGGRVGGHGRDADQALQVGADGRQDLLDGVVEGHELDATAGGSGEA